MVAALVLASCGPAEEGEEEVTPPPIEEEEEEVVVVVPPEEEEVPPEGPEMVKWTGKKADGTVVEKWHEKPRYGGVLTQGRETQPLFFDEILGHVSNAPTIMITNEELLMGDWARGPAGTGEASWLHIMFPALDTMTGMLAESWEMPDAETQVYHIRKGVYWHNKPPANGREMDAHDVVFSLIRLWQTTGSYHASVYPWDITIESITAPDKWTVVIKSLPGKAGNAFEMACDHAKIVPRDTVERYGDLNDWRNSCGTGPFMLVDYVTGSSVTFERNDEYWGKDPLHPENQLPYLDGLKWLIIPDLSTRLAALRTAKVDHLRALQWEDAESLLQTSPELKYIEYNPGGGWCLAWRIDKPDLPYYDIRVRRALNMAVNNQEIADTYFGGHAHIFTAPITPMIEYADIYTPLDEFPELIREQFEYHPDKARQLLAEAGYPDGFKTEAICYSSVHVDLLSIVKDYWAKIGVDLEIQKKEYGTYISIGARKTHQHMFVSGTISQIPFKFLTFQPGGYWNYNMVNDPRINDAFDTIMANRFDVPKRRQLMKDIVPYILEQAFRLDFPVANIDTFWWPWIKGFQGEYSVGYMNAEDFTWYVWLDQNLKEEMSGER